MKLKAKIFKKNKEVVDEKKPKDTMIKINLTYNFSKILIN